MASDTMTATAHQGETLDALVWRILGAGSGTVEQVLELNRDIAGEGAVLAEGRVVVLPRLTVTPVQERKIVQLWD